MEEAGYQKGPNGLFARDGKSFEVSITSSAGERQEAETAVYVDSLRRAGFEAVQKVTSVQDIRDPRNRALIPGIQIRGGATRLLSYVSAQIPSPETRWHGDNRGAWSSPEFDRLYEAFLSTLDRSERVKQVAEMERLLNRDAAVIPLMFSPYVVPHVGALSGPVARTTPLPGGGGTFLHVHIWQWQS
jgi:peptide/nickel transport system substrate-binding protein